MQCKWFYRNNMVFDGLDVKYNAIFFCKGFTQVHGVDYIETFALVAKMDSIRLVLVIATSMRWD